MISKNTDKFIVTVTNRQGSGNDTDCITESGCGSLRCSGGKYYIMYRTDTATVMIRKDGNGINVKRTGENKSDMDYICGKTTYFMYNTPYGAMRMDLMTESIDCRLGECGGTVKLRYVLCGIKNNMEISVNKITDEC